jgi:general L-amino acid transport system ATP-binding protein
MIDARGVEKWYPNGYHALRGCDLTVNRGEVVVIMGPSGSGKSTFIRTFNALEDFQKGTIRIDGNSLGNDLRQIDAIRREVGMVFQQFNLFPHLTVLDNLVLAPTLVRGRPRAEVQAQALNLLDRVGIKEQAQKFPGQLSGGQQQRVAIARALCMEPRILLFDEPTSSLDPEMVREVLDVMRQLAQEDITMVVVTHEVKFAEQVADRVVLMADGQVVEEATPERFFDHPQHERSRQQAMQELEAIRQEGLRVQRESQAEAERLHSDALQFRQQTQQQVDALIGRSRQEAGAIEEGANRYAEQVLGELEVRLKELSQVVLGGRRELVRLQSKDPGQVRPTEVTAVVPEAEGVSRARRTANRLRKAASRGLAS